MRIGVDYRILAVGRELINRGMSRFTQQQLRAVLGRDHENTYILLCLPGSDLTLIDPEIRGAANVSIEHFPALDERDPTVGDPGTFLRRAEDYQQWLRRQGIELYHSTTPFLVQDPLLVDFDVCPMVATFYDLIPYIYPAQYLSGWWREQYERTVTFLGRAERLQAISGSARDDAVTYMGFPPDRIDVVWPTPDESFRPLSGDEVEAALTRLRGRMILPDRFVLTVSHLHHSKNLHTLLRSFALLPPAEREATPLVVCCHLDHHGLTYLQALAERFGVAQNVVTTGLVSDAELAALYNLAVAVVHPSRYEGFGLPVVEAMRCGAAVITTTSSSLPEVAGDAGILVDPDDAPGFADAIRRLNDDADLRDRLRALGPERAALFNTEQLAGGTLASYRAAVNPGPDLDTGRPRLAVWSPFPPQQSGIADYNLELLQVLRRRYDIEVFVDDGFMPPPALLRQYRVHHYTAFSRRQEHKAFDVSLYQMGGSLFHLFMYDALRSHPGVVVLHDLTWSHVLYTHALELADMARFRREVQELEGDDAVAEWDAVEGVDPVVRQAVIDEFLAKWRMLRDVVSNSGTQIVHVEEAATELRRLYPNASPVVIPMGVTDPYRASPALEIRTARYRLGIPAGAFVVGTFGIVHSFKRLEECLQAFARLHAERPEALFFIVGRALEDSFVTHLRHRTHQLGVAASVRITGHVPRQDLDDHLIASDVILNLRLPVSRHMSATLARALAAGKPVIISDLPDWRFLPANVCLRVPLDEGEVPALTTHLRELAADGDLRARLGRAARAYYDKEGTIERMAARYADVLDGHMGASVRHGMAVADQPHAAAQDPRPLPLNKPCEFEDFNHPELLPVIRDVCGYKLSHLPADFPNQAEHRKDWEVAMAVRAFRQLGALHPDATLLGVAAGVEDTTFYLTRHVRQVFATDLYLDSGVWGSVAPLSMLADPQTVAPFEIDSNRLVVQHMDGRRLRYPDDTFDGVFSSSSVEHFGDLQDVANAAYEMGRVLKPGGVLSLSTEIRLSGPPGGIGWPGMTLVFSPENLQRFIIDASGLEPVDDLQVTVSEQTLATQRDITLAIQDHHAKVAAAGEGALDEYAMWEFPHLVLVHEGYVFTSVHLALRKPEGHPRVPNDWAKPIPATLEAIDSYNRDLVQRESTGRPGPERPGQSGGGGPERPTAEGATAPLGWYDQVDAARNGVAAMDRDHQELSEQVARVDTYLAGIDRDLVAITEGHDHAGIKVGQVAELGDHIDRWMEEVAERVPPLLEALPPGAESHRVRLREGISFEVILDYRADDQVSAFLRKGTSLDQHLLTLMLQFLRPGERLLDLGAHVGTFSLAAATAGSPALAVEGSPENVALLRASAVRNGLTNLRVVHAAAGDDPSPLEFISNGPWGRIKLEGSDEPSVTVPGVTLLELIHATGWEPLGFIKMDVEGSEIRAIRGMKPLLALAGAPPLLYESNGHTLTAYGVTTAQLMGELEALGYSTYFVEPGRMVRVNASDMQPQTLADYLAVKRVPAGLEGFSIESSMTHEERVARVVADCSHHNEHHRIYMAGALAEADEKLASHPEVTEALDRLRHDPSPAVRAAVARSAAGTNGHERHTEERP